MAQTNNSHPTSTDFTLTNLQTLEEFFARKDVDPSFYEQNKHRFAAASIAWVAAGTSDDEGLVSASEFDKKFHVFRSSCDSGSPGYDQRKDMHERLFKLTSDLTALWDRVYGGSSLLIHCDGAANPDAPIEPQYLKACVYFPPHMQGEVHGEPHPVSQLIRTAIETIGVPTVKRFHKCAQMIWTFKSKGQIPRPFPPQQGFPRSTPEYSSRYLFFGTKPQTPGPSLTQNQPETQPPSTIPTIDSNNGTTSSPVLTGLTPPLNTPTLPRRVVSFRPNPLSPHFRFHEDTIQSLKKELEHTKRKLKQATERERRLVEQNKLLRSLIAEPDFDSNTYKQEDNPVYSNASHTGDETDESSDHTGGEDHFYP